MRKTSKAIAFIEGVRALDESLSRVKLNSVETSESENKITYNFITDVVIEDFVKNCVVNYLVEFSPKTFQTVKAEFKKVVAENDLITMHVYYYLKSNCPSITLNFKREDIRVEIGEGINKFILTITESMRSYLEVNKVKESLVEYVNKNFCDDFVCEYEIVPEPTIEEYQTSVMIAKVEESINSGRVIQVEEMELIDEYNMPKEATYIEDVEEVGNYILCGKITSITERTTKNNKPYFLIRINDGTGEISGIYFTKEKTLSRIRRLEKDNEIIIRGKNEYRDERMNFNIEKINACKLLPYSKVEKKRKLPPEEYSVIIPTPFAIEEEQSFFDQKEEPIKDFFETDVVVFDTETTGTSPQINTIIEIGAYKIRNGVIIEKFSTLIDPLIPITPKITELTNISNLDVKGAPKIFEVIPDFARFCEGAVLVGHNVDFDAAFIKEAYKPFGYKLENKLIDTLALSRECLPQLKNHKLITVAEHFKLKFMAHRAYADALVTAQIFMKLINKKGSF